MKSSFFDERDCCVRDEVSPACFLDMKGDVMDSDSPLSLLTGHLRQGRQTVANSAFFVRRTRMFPAYPESGAISFQVETHFEMGKYMQKRIWKLVAPVLAAYCHAIKKVTSIMTPLTGVNTIGGM